jgi:hypothetical protein
MIAAADRVAQRIAHALDGSCAAKVVDFTVRRT